MKSRIMFIENKADGLSGPARIGRVFFSKTDRTLYYNGKAFQSLKGSGFKSNYYDLATGEKYWISGPRSDGADRLYGEAKPVEIDEDVRQEYLAGIRSAMLRPPRRSSIFLVHRTTTRRTYQPSLARFTPPPGIRGSARQAGHGVSPAPGTRPVQLASSDPAGPARTRDAAGARCSATHGRDPSCGPAGLLGREPDHGVSCLTSSCGVSGPAHT
jgi:hypothetical protein